MIKMLRRKVFDQEVKPPIYSTMTYFLMWFSYLLGRTKISNWCNCWMISSVWTFCGNPFQDRLLLVKYRTVLRRWAWLWEREANNPKREREREQASAWFEHAQKIESGHFFHRGASNSCRIRSVFRAVGVFMLVKGTKLEASYALVYILSNLSGYT